MRWRHTGAVVITILSVYNHGPTLYGGVSSKSSMPPRVTSNGGVKATSYLATRQAAMASHEIKIALAASIGVFLVVAHLRCTSLAMAFSTVTDLGRFVLTDEHAHSHPGINLTTLLDSSGS